MRLIKVFSVPLKVRWNLPLPTKFIAKKHPEYPPFPFPFHYLKVLWNPKNSQQIQSWLAGEVFLFKLTSGTVQFSSSNDTYSNSVDISVKFIMSLGSYPPLINKQNRHTHILIGVLQEDKKVQTPVYVSNEAQTVHVSNRPHPVGFNFQRAILEKLSTLHGMPSSDTSFTTPRQAVPADFAALSSSTGWHSWLAWNSENSKIAKNGRRVCRLDQASITQSATSCQENAETAFTKSHTWLVPCSTATCCGWNCSENYTQVGCMRIILFTW